MKFRATCSAGERCPASGMCGIDGGIFVAPREVSDAKGAAMSRVRSAARTFVAEYSRFLNGDKCTDKKRIKLEAIS